MVRQSISKLGLLVALAAALAGCQSYRYSEKMLNAPGEQACETDAPHVSVEMANSAQFRGVPLQVQHAFALDYGGAAVTSVQRVAIGNGEMLYKVAYIENGTPGQAVYHDDGKTAAADQGIVIRPDPGEVPIAPLPAEPATQPAGRDFQ